MLEIKPNHIILDMCASPGSKTTQILELLNYSNQGFIIANDSDSKRCYLLVHQAKRLRSPNLLVINQDAAFMPNIRFRIQDKSSAACQNDKEVKEDLYYSYLSYDQILCDVPCTGDGTLRKNPLIWSKWNIGQANSIHHLQLRILKRGLELLKVGGLLVYSTCSMNPVENEAVLSAMLEQSGDSIELVDCSEKLKGLIYEPGLTQWKVMSKDGTFYSRLEDVTDNLKENHLKNSLFPPNKEDILSQLKYCVRLYPHLQNTGGFFVTLLRKVKELPYTSVARSSDIGVDPKISRWKVKDLPFPEKDIILNENGCFNQLTNPEEGGEEANNKEGSANNTISQFKRRKKSNTRTENRFQFMKQIGDPIWDDIREFYEMSNDFDVTNLSFRSEDAQNLDKSENTVNSASPPSPQELRKETIKHNLYLVHPAIRQIILLNPDRLNVISTGLRVFSYNRSLKGNHPYRLCQDGIKLVSNYLGKRIIIMDYDDLQILFCTENPKLDNFSDLVKESLSGMDLGSICVRFTYDFTGINNVEDSQRMTFNFSAWLAPTSIRLFLNKTEIKHYTYLFDFLPPVKINQ